MEIRKELKANFLNAEDFRQRNPEASEKMITAISDLRVLAWPFIEEALKEFQKVPALFDYDDHFEDDAVGFIITLRAGYWITVTIGSVNVEDRYFPYIKMKARRVPMAYGTQIQDLVVFRGNCTAENFRFLLSNIHNIGEWKPAE